MRSVGTEKKTTRDGKEIIINKVELIYPNGICKECELRTRKNGSSRCDKCSKKN